MTNDIYDKNKYGIYENHYQYKTISSIKSSKGYTPLVIDLIDDVNQKTVRKNSAYPDDKVSGYTLS